MINHETQDFLVIETLDDFDHRSGSRLEQILFNNRLIVVALCLIVSAFLGFQTLHLEVNAEFEKTFPSSHRFIQNFRQNQQDLSGLGNIVRVVVQTTGDSIFEPAYQEALQDLSSELFLLPGVDRAGVKSLWTPNARWVGVTEMGLESGPIIPYDYDGSERTMAVLKANVERSGEIGQLVAPDFQSSMIVVPLLSNSPDPSTRIDYSAFSQNLEKIREKYESKGVKIYIVGFAKVIGDLIEGVQAVLIFFLVAILLASAVLFTYTRCLRSTFIVVVCSVVAVVWQLGLLPLIGHSLDPYSVLVPFLIFAIGMSHGAQKMNGIMQDIGRGTHRIVAARYTFRRLFMAGLTALLCDVVGFAVLLIIDIPAIRDLAMLASIGVGILIFTNLILLPILLSYIGVAPAAAKRSLKHELDMAQGREHAYLWRLLDKFTTPRWAAGAVLCGLALAVFGFQTSLQLKIGDLDAGAPELRSNSRYNQDNTYVVSNYLASSDVFAIIVRTPTDECARYDTLMRVDALEWQLRQVEGVNATKSMASVTRELLTGLNEGSVKWYELQNNQGMLNASASEAPRDLMNPDCSMLLVLSYLDDHKADTLERVVKVAERFATANSTEDVHFLLAAGSAGIEAATNMVVEEASREMLFWVYAAVILLSFVTFRSIRAVIVAVLPLMLTSILAEALMVWLGMGVKVATLPVIALGVGIGIDYALYVLSVTVAALRSGASLSEAYLRALMFTGKVVMLTGITLALGVATWVLSPIKFQADMGILLTFMFLWNMLGALVLLPALACLLYPEARAPQAKSEASPSAPAGARLS